MGNKSQIGIGYTMTKYMAKISSIQSIEEAA